MHLRTYFLSTFKKNRTRYIGCILGFSLALGSVFSLTNYSNMLDRMVSQIFIVDENSLMVLSEGTSMAQFIPFSSIIPEDIKEDIEEKYGIQKVIPIIFKDFSNQSSTKYIKEAIMGINLDYLEETYLKSTQLDRGTWPDKEKNEILIGSNIGGGQHIPGDQLNIKNETFTISGILKPDNPLLDAIIYCDYDSIQNIYQMDNYCSILYAFFDSTAFSHDYTYEDFITSIDDISVTIQVLDSERLEESTGGFFKIMNYVQIFLSTFPFIIGIMFVSILLILNIKDQMKEFGILQAIGMPDRSIIVIIYSQVIVISLMSYLGAIIAGILLFFYSYSSMLQFQTQFATFSDFLEEMASIFPFPTFINTLIATLAVGMIIALIPLLKWKKMNIVEIFRTDE